MDDKNLLILLIALIISLSGIVINMIKKGDNEKIKFIKDGATLFWFRVIIPFALVISLVFYFSKIGCLSWTILSLYLGCFLVVLGLSIRWISVISLGNAFTVKVSILENHSLKTDGIYKYIRHPSYTGILVYYFGLGLVMQNWICIIILIIAPLLVVVNRIQVEEKVLIQNFLNDYKTYQKRSWRLFPFIF
jgi:protein-S-isoprenylcysteine O-methyltransferase Ste14